MLEAYHRLLAQWHANGQQVLPQSSDVGVDKLVSAFMRHAESYYRKPDGTPTSETDTFRQAFRPLEALYARTPARDFGPKALRAIQQEMIRLNWCRRNIKHAGQQDPLVLQVGSLLRIAPPNRLRRAAHRCPAQARPLRRP